MNAENIRNCFIESQEVPLKVPIIYDFENLSNYLSWLERFEEESLHSVLIIK